MDGDRDFQLGYGDCMGPVDECVAILRWILNARIQLELACNLSGHGVSLSDRLIKIEQLDIHVNNSYVAKAKSATLTRRQ